MRSDPSFSQRERTPFYESPGDSWADAKKFYASAAWRKRRAAHVAEHPECQVCGARRKALHVHHKYGFRNSPFDHLITLCASCHQVLELVARRKGNMTRDHLGTLYDLAMEKIQCSKPPPGS